MQILKKIFNDQYSITNIQVKSDHKREVLKFKIACSTCAVNIERWAGRKTFNTQYSILNI